MSIHIGINSVDPAVYGSSLALRGCENDARAMQALAQLAGFDMSVSTMLLSSQATAGAVSGVIHAAAARLQSEDLLFLTYSGHGGQVPDPSEPDGKNETWVLFDRMLIDDELSRLWSEFAPGVRILVLSDSCHSGTVIRGAPGQYYDATRRATLAAMPAITREIVGLDDQVQSATKELPFSVQARVYADSKQFYDSIPRAKDVTPNASVILISGCQDNQVSLDGTVNGLFTEKLLAVWGNGAFTGDHPALRDAIAALLPPTQSPNYFTAGTPSLTFQRQRPLTVPAPVSDAVPVGQSSSPAPAPMNLFERLQQQFAITPKEKEMTDTTTTTDVPQEKWLEFLPQAIDLGLQVVDALSKAGYELQSSSGQKVVTTRDAAGQEKWLQFIPLAITIGSQAYEALRKEGALPPNKQVPLPRDFGPESAKGWTDLLPTVLYMGSQLLEAATKQGAATKQRFVVANGAETPRLDDPEAKGWIDLIPTALKIGQRISETLSRSAPVGVDTVAGMRGLARSVPAMQGGGGYTSKDVAPQGAAAKEVVASFSDEVLAAARG